MDIPGLLGRLAGLPGAINQGLLGSMPVDPRLGIDPQMLQQARQGAGTDFAMGLVAGGNDPRTLLAARRGATEGFRGRVFDLLKEQETSKMMAARDEQQKQQDMLEASMRGSPVPEGLPLPQEVWDAIPAKDKVTLYGQYVPKAPKGPMSVSPGSALVDPATGQELYKNPALPRGEPIQILMPGQLPSNIPAQVRTAVAGNEEIIRTIDKTIAAYEGYSKKHPGKSPTSPLRQAGVVAADAVMPGSPGVAISDVMDPEGTVIRQGVADIGSMVFHDRSGAAVTLSESPRLRPFVPEGNKYMETNITNMKHIRDKAAAENSILLQSYGVPYSPGQFGAQEQPQQAQQPQVDKADIGRGPPDETREADGVRYHRYGDQWFKEQN